MQRFKIPDFKPDYRLKNTLLIPDLISFPLDNEIFKQSTTTFQKEFNLRKCADIIMEFSSVILKDKIS